MTPFMPPPNSPDGEQYVLGAALISSSAAATVVARARREDFTYGPHRLVFDAICRLAARDSAVDEGTVIHELRQAGRLDKAGGTGYVMTLSGSVPTAAHVEHYLDAIQELTFRRRLLRVSGELTGLAHDGDRPAAEVRDEALAKVYDACKVESRWARPAQDMVTACADALEWLGGTDEPGLGTGLPSLDEYVLLRPGELVIVAGRPSMGKTAFAATHLALHAANQGLSVCIYTTEMSAREIIVRAASRISDVPFTWIGKRKLSTSQTELVAAAIGQVSELPIRIDDREAGIDRIRAETRLARTRGECDLVVIDYLQLLTAPPGHKTRNEAIGHITRQAKHMARELEIPVVVVSQLSRNLERRDDKRPNLADLRDSGEIEQDADIVLFAHRPAYWQRDAPEEERWRTELIVGKNRSGPTGTAVVRGYLPTCRYDELAENVPEAPPERRLPD